jgi:hypothetical protein
MGVGGDADARCVTKGDDKGDDKGLPDDGDRFTVAEMHDSIEALSDADVAKLVAASRAFCRLCGNRNSY